MTAPSFGFAALDMAWDVATSFVVSLSAPAFAFAGQAVTRLNAFVAGLTAPAFSFVGQAVTRLNAFAAQLSAGVVSFAGQALDYIEGEEEPPAGGDYSGGCRGSKLFLFRRLK